MVSRYRNRISRTTRRWLAPDFHHSQIRWQLDGACNNYDPAWWDTDVAAPADVRKALLICWTECPVRRECTEFSMRKGRGEESGIWGGIRPADRRTIMRRRERQSLTSQERQ